jgi:hypothetical protein
LADYKTGDDQRFVRFKSPEYGLRAIALTLMTYEKKYGINTCEGIAKRWAPSPENNTQAYADHLAQALSSPELKIEAYDYIDLDDYETMLKLVETIVLHENGRQPYTAAKIAEGLRMAGVHNVPRKPILKVASFNTQAIGGTLMGAGALAPKTKEWSDQLEPFVGSVIGAHLQTIVLSGGAILLILGAVGIWLKNRKS